VPLDFAALEIENDIGPYNTIYVEKMAVAFIDFESAAPGPRLWDVAFAVYRFARLCELSNISGVSGAHLDRVAQRIRRFCDYYDFQERADLLDAVLRRLKYQIVWMSSPENIDIQHRGTAEEHLAFYRRDTVAIARHAEKLGQYL
jgi:thiamine kinase-like enzyme